MAEQRPTVKVPGVGELTLEFVRDVLAKRTDRYRYDWLLELRDATEVNVATKGVLFVIGMACSGDGTGSYMRVSTIADRCNLRERATSNHIAAALASGWIIRTRKGHKVGRGEGAFGSTSEYACVIPSRQEFAGSEESPTGTDVPDGSSQHADPCDPTGTNAPPSTHDVAAKGFEASKKTSPHDDVTRDRGPFDFDAARAGAKNGADRARENLGSRYRRPTEEVG
ncbi:hypothetical protein [Actinospongicola halichondriae]|uniref:hypothetical protein n=1 Tax=Actinospongicola halichondriae TaxID=3236844 RepID=UPI003D4EB055